MHQTRGISHYVQVNTKPFYKQTGLLNNTIMKLLTYKKCLKFRAGFVLQKI